MVAEAVLLPETGSDVAAENVCHCRLNGQATAQRSQAPGFGLVHRSAVAGQAITPLERPAGGVMWETMAAPVGMRHRQTVFVAV